MQSVNTQLSSGEHMQTQLRYMRMRKDSQYAHNAVPWDSHIIDYRLQYRCYACFRLYRDELY